MNMKCFPIFVSKNVLFAYGMLQEPCRANHTIHKNAVIDGTGLQYLASE